MGASRLLVALLLAVAIGLAVYAVGHRIARRRGLSAGGTPVEGFAGWLLVLAIGQWVAVLILLGQAARLVTGYQHHLVEPGAGLGATTMIIVHLAALAFVAWAAVLMMRKSRLYPRLLRIELVLLVILPPLGAIGMTDQTASYVTPPKLWIAAALRLALAAILAALWSLYAQHSRRVRNTFVR